MTYNMEDNIPTFIRTQGWLRVETSFIIRLKSRDKGIISLSKPQPRTGHQFTAVEGNVDTSGNSQEE